MSAMTKRDRVDGRRERILRSAVRLFAERGYHATSLKDLARKAGMTAPNLYHYYESKEDILFEVYNLQLTRLIAQQEQIERNETDPTERLRSFAYNLVYTDLDDPLAGFVPSNRLLGLRGTNAKLIREQMRTVRHQWLSVVEEGGASGVFRVEHPELAVLNAITMCSYVATWFDPEGELSKSDVAKQTAEACLRIAGCIQP